MADNEEYEDDMTYPVEIVEPIVAEVSEEVLKDEMWDEVKVPQLIN